MLMLNNGRAALAEETIRRYAPSVFAEEAHESRSDRYTYIPTIAVIRGLMKEGWQVFGVQQARTRDESRREHTKHVVRMRRPGAALMVGDTVAEICVMNSHDGTSAYRLTAGLFRLVCTNGLVVGDNWSDVRVPHKGDVVANCIEGSFELVKLFDGIRDSVERMKERQTKGFERVAFATGAAQLRFDPESNTRMPTVDQVLAPRRYEDKKDDLWTVFNRAQENLVRGGIRTVSVNPETRRQRRAESREIKGIDQNIKINRALFTMAELLEQGRAQEAAEAARRGEKLAA